MSDDIIKYTIYWGEFYQMLDQEIKKTYPKKPKEEKFDYAVFKKEMELHNARRLEIVKSKISATHKWIPGKMHWSGRGDERREFQAPLECSVCKLAASIHEEIEFVNRKIDFENGEMPSRDSHGHLIHRTCQEVQGAREDYRRKRKGRKCGQCRTYGCIDD